MKAMRVAAHVCLLATTSGTLAHAQDAEPPAVVSSDQTALEMRSAQVVALINGNLDLPLEDVFTSAFLAAVPPEQLQVISRQLTGQFGAAIKVEELGAPSATRSALAIRMERAIARGGIGIDPADGNRINELLFQTFDPVDDGPEKILADLEALPGKVSAYFGPIEVGTPTISMAPAEQMALGSTFKLYVLAALAKDVSEGTRSWDDIVELSAKSYPSGMMQNWPSGAPVTLHTLASLMISISDNTATDELIKILGRETVERAVQASGHGSASLNVPFMTTREMFLLKGGSAEQLARYAASDSVARFEILEGLEDDPPTEEAIQTAFRGGPIAIDVEWFASTQDLARLFQYMRRTADPQAFDIMAINPSIPANIRNAWSYAGHKGGSEPGVLNLTWLLTDEVGEDMMLALSWSNPDANVDETVLELIAQRILSLPR